LLTPTIEKMIFLSSTVAINFYYVFIVKGVIGVKGVKGVKADSFEYD